MGKSNMLLGLAQGKVGSLVFYRDGGEQRFRPLVTPKNPRTPAQMAQRAKMANVPALYRCLSSILADSFTSRPSNQSGYNAFAASAIPLSPYLTRTQVLAGVCLPMPCQLSKGPLQPLQFDSVTLDGEYAYGLSIELEATAATTVGQVSAALLAQYPSLSLGDKIVAVRVQFAERTDALEDVDSWYPIPEVASFIVDTSSSELLEESEFRIVEGYLVYRRLSQLIDPAVIMYGYFVARVNENGALQTSSSWAQLTTSAQALYDGYRTAAAEADAIQSYGNGESNVLREKE